MSQPVEVYPPPFPIPVAQRPAAPHHANGSFGTVFIVLAVIFAVSAIACILGRLCSRRRGHSKGGKHNHQAALRSKERDAKKSHPSQPKDGDLEFGFDKRFSSAKVAANEDFGGGPNAFHNGATGNEGGREFGFDKRFPSGKSAANEEFTEPKSFHNGAAGGEGGIEHGFDKRFPSGKGSSSEEIRGPTTFHNAQLRREMRFADERN